MKTLTNMKKVCCSNRFFLSVMAICLITAFSSCDNEETPDVPPVPALTDVEGSYAGKMISLSALPKEASTEEPQGTEVTAKVENSNIAFEKFPVDDLIKGIISDEQTAETIIGAIGDINYKIAYKASFNEKKDSIFVEMTPEPLEIKFELPAEQEGGEATKMNVKVTIATNEKGNFAYESNKLKFSFYTTGVTVNDAPFEFPTTIFDFNLNKK